MDDFLLSETKRVRCLVSLPYRSHFINENVLTTTCTLEDRFLGRVCVFVYLCVWVRACVCKGESLFDDRTKTCLSFYQMTGRRVFLLEKMTGQRLFSRKIMTGQRVFLKKKKHRRRYYQTTIGPNLHAIFVEQHFFEQEKVDIIPSQSL